MESRPASTSPLAAAGKQREETNKEKVATTEDKDNPFTAICQNINKRKKLVTPLGVASPDLTDSEDDEEDEVVMRKTIGLKGGSDNNPRQNTTNQGSYI